MLLEREIEETQQDRRQQGIHWYRNESFIIESAFAMLLPKGHGEILTNLLLSKRAQISVMFSHL